MLARSSEREHHDTLRSRADELAADLRPDPHQAVRPEHVLAAFDQERQLALEHDVDLLLAFMRVDPPPLPGLEHDEIHPEGGHTEFAPQRLETLAAVAIESGERDARIGHGVSIEPRNGTQARLRR